MEQIRLQLIKIFAETLNIDPEKAPKATMENTGAWDSFAHMTLMVAIESEIMTDTISTDDIVTLTSFEQILTYISNNSTT